VLTFSARLQFSAMAKSLPLLHLARRIDPLDPAIYDPESAYDGTFFRARIRRSRRVVQSRCR